MVANSAHVVPIQEETNEVSLIQEDHKHVELNHLNSVTPNVTRQGPSNTHGASFARSFLNLINVFSGIGVLSIPYAVSQGGWLSLMIFLLFGVICSYTGILIQRCMRADQSIKSYPDIGYHAFGRIGQNIIAIFIYMELYLVSISFLIIEGDNLNKLFPGTKLEFSLIKLEGKKLFILLAAGIILPTTWLRDLAVLAYVSAIGLVTSVVLTGSLIWACIDNKGLHLMKVDMLKLHGLPTSFGLYLVCFAGHPVFPTIYSSMKKEKQFSKVLFMSTILCTLNYVLTAVLGYLLYGNEVQSQVTLNLPSEKIYSKIAIYTTLINPLTRYALLTSPITTAIEERISLTIKRSTSLVIRTLLLVSTIVLANYLPFFGYLMSFVGSFMNVVVSVLFPCLCYLKIYKTFYGVSVELVSIVIILIMGVLVAVIGTYTSLREIVSEL